MLGLAIGFTAFTIFCVGSRDPDNVYYEAFLRTSLLLGIFAVSPVTRAFAIRPTLELSEPCTEPARSPTPTP